MRIVLAWVGAVTVVAGAIVGGIAIANATVFSASAFVGDYLDALAAGRVEEVLALPGVDVGALDSRALDPRALQSFGYTITGDAERAGVHRVTVAFTSAGTTGETSFSVERIGTRFGLFPEWGFADSPITPMTVTPTGDARFQLGPLALDAPGGAPRTFAVFTPGAYRLAHRSAFLTADEVEVVATGAPVSVELEIVPSEAFVSAVQLAVEADLAACASQEVLFPTGCPFGYAIENRVVSPPQWSIIRMPTAEIAASDRLGIWAVPPAEGVAQLRVRVQSLFDGSVTTFEKKVPFEANYLIAFDGDRIVLDPGF